MAMSMARAWLDSLAVVLVAGLLKLLQATLRWEIQVPPGYSQRLFESFSEPRVLAFWHGEQLLMSFAALRAGARKDSIYALISQHRDGRLIAAVVQRLGIQSVAGSSTRGGTEALRGLLRCLRQGHHVAVTPDGPKGPRHSCKSGVVALAKLSGFPILPMSVHFDRKWTFGSWDKMELPKPFSRAYVQYGELMSVHREATEEEVEEARKKLEHTLIAMDTAGRLRAGGDS